MKLEEVRALLAAEDVNAFDDIVYQRVLGASKHIEMIGQMLLHIALESDKRNVQERMNAILTVADYFKRTRGEASQAITNAIDKMLAALRTEIGKELALEVAAKNAIGSYHTQAKEDIDVVVKTACELFKDFNTLMLFDYSSTVNALIRSLEKPMTLYIPESRSINGGYQFARTALQSGHKVKFIPDAAIYHFMPQCDAALFGAETFFADGTAFNTTGSDLVGLACKACNVPLYVLTPMIKLDRRSIYGITRKLVTNDLASKFTGVGLTEEEMRQIDFNCPELLGVKPDYITAFVTEEGVVPTMELFARSVAYAEKLNGDASYDE